MREVVKLATGVAARCPANVIKCLPWFLLAGALYGGWLWANSACSVFGAAPSDSSGWQKVYAIAFIVWCIANFFGTIMSCILVSNKEFRNELLPVWWGSIWYPRRDVCLFEPPLWIVFAPSIAIATLTEVAIRAGSIKIRKSQS